MVTVDSAQLHQWLVLFVWPLFRLLAFMMTAPVLGHHAIPRTVKLGLALLLTFLIAPTLPAPPPIPVWSWAGMGIIVEQVLIGAAMGLLLRVVFAAVMVAGDYVGLQMGLAFATFVSPDTGTNTMILARILYIIAILMFLALDGQLMVIQTLAYSFHTLPIGYGSLNVDAFNLLVRAGSTVFTAGLVLALPLVTALLIVNLCLGILNRSAPQMTVFSVGFPTSLLLGIFLLAMMMGDLGRYLDVLFGHGLDMLHALIQAMAPAPP
ncbi:MAG TPA: flagellar biosynthetic protein FliR [Oleiagrimonas sp.]|nr:flagellar biosynthetic protein FliR [Oleiagrimonas sp.]